MEQHDIETTLWSWHVTIMCNSPKPCRPLDWTDTAATKSILNFCPKYGDPHTVNPLSEAFRRMVGFGSQQPIENM